MNRKEVKKRVQQYSPEELIQWREHVLVCLEQFKADRNQFEIEECQYLLQLIDEQLKKKRTKM